MTGPVPSQRFRLSLGIPGPRLRRPKPKVPSCWSPFVLELPMSLSLFAGDGSLLHPRFGARPEFGLRRCANPHHGAHAAASVVSHGRISQQITVPNSGQISRSWCKSDSLLMDTKFGWPAAAPTWSVFARFCFTAAWMTWGSLARTTPRFIHCCC